MATISEGVKKGSKVLLLNGHKYQKNNIGAQKLFWHCWKKGCRARIQTNIFNIDIDDQNIQIFNDHNHPVVDELLESTAIKNQMVRAIRADPTSVIEILKSKIFHNLTASDPY